MRSMAYLRIQLDTEVRRMSVNSFRSQARIPVHGSERKPLAANRARTAADVSKDKITVTVLVRRKQPIDPATFAPGQHLDHATFDTRHGADPSSIDAVRAFAAEYGLEVLPATDSGRRTVYVTGTQQQLEEAFAVQLQHDQLEGHTVRARQGLVYIPDALGGHVDAVLGLDNRPQAKAHFRIAKPRATNISYTPTQVAQLYGFPSGASAAGQTIGLIELGGGFQQSDISAYFQSLGIAAPKVTAVLVDGGTNSPGDPNGADGEVMLDIEVAGAVAPGAAIAVYFCPNTDAGFLDAITSAAHDTTNHPHVISISWGGPESTWTQQAMTAMDDAFQAAASLGISVTVAVGDDGSSDGVTSGGNHVDFPASSPHVLACGGTRLAGSGSIISSEVVWNESSLNEGATGGGVSAIFPKPTYQASANVPRPTTSGGGRGVPDVAGNADPSTGYQVRVDGQSSVIGGTSAVAPLWAGLLTLANAANKTSAGLVNTALYAANEASAFRDIVTGDNGAFAAAKGWDACTGLGSPIGTAVVNVLRGTRNS
jgi:kumamolisin